MALFTLWSAPASNTEPMTPDEPSQDETPEDEIVIAPGGPRFRSTIHEVPTGYEVRADADGTLHVVPVPES